MSPADIKAKVSALRDALAAVTHLSQELAEITAGDNDAAFADLATLEALSEIRGRCCFMAERVELSAEIGVDQYLRQHGVRCLPRVKEVLEAGFNAIMDGCICPACKAARAEAIKSAVDAGSRS